jgi:hypothetical protein
MSLSKVELELEVRGLHHAKTRSGVKFGPQTWRIGHANTKSGVKVSALSEENEISANL